MLVADICASGQLPLGVPLGCRTRWALPCGAHPTVSESGAQMQRRSCAEVTQGCHLVLQPSNPCPGWVLLGQLELGLSAVAPEHQASWAVHHVPSVLCSPTAVPWCPASRYGRALPPSSTSFCAFVSVSSNVLWALWSVLIALCPGIGLWVGGGERSSRWARGGRHSVLTSGASGPGGVTSAVVGLSAPLPRFILKELQGGHTEIFLSVGLLPRWLKQLLLESGLSPQFPLVPPSGCRGSDP